MSESVYPWEGDKVSFLAETEVPQRLWERHRDYTDLIRGFKQRRRQREKNRVKPATKQ